MRDAKRKTAFWFRWLHVYTSMASLVLVLFFGLTGLTLNHPSWTLGDRSSVESVSGSLPVGYEVDGVVDFLAVTEFVRDRHDVKGSVEDYRASETQGSVSFKGPGYAADLGFEVASGSYELMIQREGWVAVFNDIHKGRDTNSSWSLVIDISAILLVLVSVTGLGTQLLMRKRRTVAVAVSAGAGLVAIVFIYFTLA